MNVEGSTILNYQYYEIALSFKLSYDNVTLRFSHIKHVNDNEFSHISSYYHKLFHDENHLKDDKKCKLKFKMGHEDDTRTIQKIKASSQIQNLLYILEINEKTLSKLAISKIQDDLKELFENLELSLI